MRHLLLQELPRYECLQEAAKRYPTLNPSGVDAFLNLLRTSDLVAEAEGRELGKWGISSGRFTILMLLNGMCGSAISPADLAEESGVTRATISGLLDTMERDRLVTRSPSPEDRRAVEVKLTPAGQVLIDEALPGYFARVEEFIRPLSVDERSHFVLLLQKIQAAVVDPTLNAKAAASVLTR